MSGIQTSSRCRRARRLSWAARVIVGVEDIVLQYLPSDDDHFFGTPAISSDRSSSEDKSSLQLSTKVPCVADSWSDSNSSSSESISYCTEEIDFSVDGDDSEEEPANEKTTVNMGQDVSDGCTCRCKDHNHFNVRAAQTLVTVERQMRETRGRDMDKLMFVIGMLTASQNEAAVTHHAKLLLVLRVHVLRLNTQSRTSLFANQCSVPFIG